MGLLLFKKVFFDAIRSGRKQTTLRRWDRARVSAGQKVFCPGLGYLLVEAVETADWNELTEADAVADGFTSLAGMQQTLLWLYPPDENDGKQWWRVRFHWIRPAGWTETGRLFAEEG